MADQNSDSTEPQETSAETAETSFEDSAPETVQEELDAASSDTAEAGESYSEQFGEPAVDAAYDEHDPEERGGSLSSKLLTWLLLLLGGAGLALWGGPKIAPNVPEWAAPVAKFLTPGGDAAMRDVTALRSEVTERLEALPEVPQSAEIAETVSAQMGAELEAAQAATGARIDALETKLDNADASGMEARIATLESQLEGVSAELSSLSGSMQSALAEGGTLSEEALAEISSKTAEVEGMRAQIAQMSEQVATLTQRIEDMEANSAAELEAAQAEAARIQEESAANAASVAAAAALEELSARASLGEPFAAELERFSSASGTEIPASLLDHAANGVTSLANLQTEFDALSHAAIRASIKAESADGGAASRFGAFLKSQVATRSLDAVEGDGTDAVLSRIGAALTNGDLETVVSEADTLSDEARAPLEGWLEQVSSRHAVLGTIAALAAQPS